MSHITSRGHVGRTIIRGCAILAVASAPLIGVSAAQAANVNVSYSASFWPVAYDWDGAGTAPTAGSTGSASVSVDQNYLPTGATPFCHAPVDTGYDGECMSVQVRGGAALPTRDANGNRVATSAVPGDTLQATLIAGYDSTTRTNTPGAVVTSATVPAPQAVTSSVIGSTTATVGRTSDAGYVDVEVLRRTARTVYHDRVVPGTLHWLAVNPSTDEEGPVTPTACYPFDDATQTYLTVPAVVPPKPTTDPGAPKQWVLKGDNCDIDEDAVPGSPYRTLMQGRITAVSDSAYTVTFPQPLAAGDLIDATQITESTVNDVKTSFTLENIVPVGTVPPPPPADVTPPKVQAFDFGATGVSVKSFKKSGLLTFIALDEPSTVSEQLTALPAKTKSKKKGKKKSKASKVPVVIATGTGGTTGPGQTARVPLVITPAGTKLVKGYKGKPVHATLTTTVTDKAGNHVTSTSTYTLTA